MKGRDRESSRIKKANKASAVGKLFLSEIKDWSEFLETDLIDLPSLPRRSLRAGVHDVRIRLSKEIKKFCRLNFTNMTEDMLSDLYEEIKAHRGFEIPLTRIIHRADLDGVWGV